MIDPGRLVVLVRQIVSTEMDALRITARLEAVEARMECVQRMIEARAATVLPTASDLSEEHLRRIQADARLSDRITLPSRWLDEIIERLLR